MSELDPKIEELQARLNRLVRTQIDFQTEVLRIRDELARLRGSKDTAEPSQTKPMYQPPPVESRQAPPSRQRPPVRPPESTARAVPPSTFGTRTDEPDFESAAESESAFSRYASSYADSARADLEKFIGENLLSKIGIIVLVLGVGIGAKYAIDNNLISPLTRIIIGYIFGFGLVGLAIKLKPKYLNFSAVLLSGGMAIMYFVTYFAYASYSLIPQTAAFALMAMFTLFTVAAALIYNRQVIAHIGLVGAYAVPFLLSSESGNYAVLFGYMAMINAGILAISVKRYWKPLFYTSFGFTWLIFFAWFSGKYSPADHFYLALVFLAIFFATFYATKIVHGVLHAESDQEENLISIFVTAAVFYGFCFAIGDVQAAAREYVAFFTYLAAISLAILITSYRFYGRVLVYLSYPFTWLIFGAWFSKHYRAEEHFYLAGIFAAVFFAVYYGATIVYRLITDEDRLIENSGLVLTNSFIFYGFGYAIIGSRETSHGIEGLYTATHSAMHLGVAHLVNRLRSSAADVIQVLTILILTFATIAIPVHFNGNYVTLIWSVEAALLFWFGRARQVRLFEYFSYPVMLLATGSLFLDWAAAYGQRTMYASEFNRQPIANGDFITALVFVAAFAFIYVTNRDERHEGAVDIEFVRPIGYAIAAVCLFVLYNTFRTEISNYFHIQAVRSAAADSLNTLGDYADRDLGRFNIIWQLNYTMFFLVSMWFVNLRKFRSKNVAYAGVALSIISLVVFVTAGMLLFFELRESYMAGEAAGGFLNIGIRYISFAFAAALLYSLWDYSRDEHFTESIPQEHLRSGFDAILYAAILIVASCELVNLMAQFHLPDANKLGLSILWGLYALILIVIGIAKSRKYLRIAAIVLLAVTLAKLFLYDIADLDTIPKTVLFVSLGILLLIVSFLYNKYKAFIFKVGAEQE